MRNTLIKNLIKPFMARIGTMLGTWLMVQGVTGTDSELIVSGLLAAGLFSVDLISDFIFKSAK